MNIFLDWIVRVYIQVLNLYPDRFKESILGSNSYWLNHGGMHLSGASRMLVMAGKIALVMLVPAWLELLRRPVGRLRTT